MIEQIAEPCVEVTYLAFLASWRALPVFAIVAVLAMVLRNRLPARYLCWLWLIVIARLLLPFSVESTVAISSIADKPARTLVSGDEEVAVDSVGFDTFTYEDDDGKSVTVALLPPGATAEEQAAADAYVSKISSEELALSASNASQQQYNQVNAIESPSAKPDTLLEFIAYSIVLALPAIGVVLLLRSFASHVRFALALRTLPLVNDRATIDCLLRVCDELGVGRRPKLKEVPSLHAPAMFGVFRPVICLPTRWRERLTTKQLEWVFRHEVAHVKGRDGLLLSMATLARSLHWFNPLSWIAVAKLQYSMERAADELVTLHLNETQVREYGELLLQFAAGQPSPRTRPTIGLLAMAAPKGLGQRIESLGTPVRSRSWLRELVAISAIGMVAICGLTDAKPIETPVVKPRPVPNFEVALSGGDWKRPDDLIQSPTVPDTRVVSINVEKALRKAKELEPRIDAERFVLNYFAMYPVTSDQRADAIITDGMMTVEVTKPQETLIKQMLSAFEKSGLWQIVTELRVIDTNIKLLDQFDWSTSETTARVARLDRAPVLDNPELWPEATLSFNALGLSPSTNENYRIEQSASMPIRAAKISRLQSERFIRQLQLDSRSNLMQAPKVTMFNGQCAVISDVYQRPFVTDVWEIAGDKATAIQPKISVFEDGWKFLLKTTVSSDEDVKLQMVLTQASVEGVKLASLPNSRSNDPDQRVTIQVPTVKSDSIAVESMLKESEALLVFSPKPYSSESDEDDNKSNFGIGQVFMIRTQLISDHEFLKGFVPEQDDD
ncbi:M56 family metallopeptidase [Rubripirellula reticaptiva]|uniref:Regulatory protein BlaR1 n=1 Tax=Rubripirellula reticaptiva TaxID=2528013 RepID=A0A5C6EA30_9BACT|nr:M56 family metallopeptidase [Rubripirellula reticaptiva]TWU46563.1 Regulatory protein BlaR1 [Rubripirellula reticaptiva]